MLECWNDKPMARPSFSECSRRVESLLQDSVREVILIIRLINANLKISLKY